MQTTSYSDPVTTSPIQVLIIQPDGSHDVRQVEQDIATFQGLVGGLVEAITTEAAVFWCHEEGKLQDQPCNTLATYLWWQFEPAMESKEVLQGPVFVTGQTDDIGDSLPVQPSVVELFERIKSAWEQHKDDWPPLCHPRCVAQLAQRLPEAQPPQ
jgi:hypothetical protein